MCCVGLPKVVSLPVVVPLCKAATAFVVAAGRCAPCIGQLPVLVILPGARLYNCLRPALLMFDAPLL